MSTGNPMYPQTEGERLLGWKPVNFQYEPFDLRRYRRTAAKKAQRHHTWVVYADPMPHQIPGNPEATPECDAIHDCDWIVYRCNYPADFDGGVAL